MPCPLRKHVAVVGFIAAVFAALLACFTGEHSTFSFDHARRRDDANPTETDASVLDDDSKEVGDDEGGETTTHRRARRRRT